MAGNTDKRRIRANGTLELMVSYPARDLEEFMLPNQIMQVHEMLGETARKLWSDSIDPESTERARAKFLRLARRTHIDIQRLTRDRDGTHEQDTPAETPTEQLQPLSSWLDGPFPQWRVETVERLIGLPPKFPRAVTKNEEPALPRRRSGYGPAEAPPRTRGED